MGKESSSDNKTKLLEATKKDNEFISSVKDLLDKCKNLNSKSISEIYYPLFSTQTLYRVMTLGKRLKDNKIKRENKVNQGFNTTTRDYFKLIRDPSKFSITYNLIGKILHQERSDFEKLEENLHGSYFYYRFFPSATDPSIFEYVKGKIEISVKNQKAEVSHWSHNYGPQDIFPSQPEHKGYAYYVAGRVILIMFRPKVLRIVTGHVHEDNGNSPINGIVHSVMKDPPHTTFTARVIIINEKNKELTSAFSPENDPSGILFRKSIAKDIHPEYGFIYGTHR